MLDDQEEPWEGRRSMEVRAFATKVEELHRSNPYELNALDHIMNELMTELWDHGFSQTEIRAAYEKAVADMPRYAAGEERRGDRKQP
jgi:hypothetical protein